MAQSGVVRQISAEWVIQTAHNIVWEHKVHHFNVWFPNIKAFEYHQEKEFYYIRHLFEEYLDLQYPGRRRQQRGDYTVTFPSVNYAIDFRIEAPCLYPPGIDITPRPDEAPSIAPVRNNRRKARVAKKKKAAKKVKAPSPTPIESKAETVVPSSSSSSSAISVTMSARADVDWITRDQHKSMRTFEEICQLVEDADMQTKLLARNPFVSAINASNHREVVVTMRDDTKEEDQRKTVLPRSFWKYGVRFYKYNKYGVPNHGARNPAESSIIAAKTGSWVTQMSYQATIADAQPSIRDVPAQVKDLAIEQLICRINPAVVCVQVVEKQGYFNTHPQIRVTLHCDTPQGASDTIRLPVAFWRFGVNVETDTK